MAFVPFCVRLPPASRCVTVKSPGNRACEVPTTRPLTATLPRAASIAPDPAWPTITLGSASSNSQPALERQPLAIHLFLRTRRPRMVTEPSSGNDRVLRIRPKSFGVKSLDGYTSRPAISPSNLSYGDAKDHPFAQALSLR